MKAARFILAIESYLVRKGMLALLNHMQGIRVIREYQESGSLAENLKHHTGDYLVICQSLFDQTSDLFHSQPHLLERTLLLKHDPSVEPTKALHGTLFLSDGEKEIRDKVLSLVEIHAPLSHGNRIAELTQREITIVRLVSLGFTNKQIADKLFLSTHTVTTHRKNITGKLGIKSVSGLTVYAIVNNIITIEEVTLKPSE